MVVTVLLDVARPRRPLARRSSSRSSRAATRGCSATRTSATSPTTSCRPGSASWCAATPLGEGEGISRTTVLGTVVVERIVDTVIVVGLAALAVVVLSVGGVMSTAVVCSAPAFVGLLVLGLVVAMASHRLPGADRVTAFAERWPRILELARRLRDGPGGREPAGRRSLGALLFSAVAWTASIATFMAGGRAVGIELTVAQAALLSSGVALATIVPSAPGYVGTFELTAVVDRDDLRHRPRRGVRDGPAGPRDDPGRDVDRRRHRRAPAGRGSARPTRRLEVATRRPVRPRSARTVVDELASGRARSVAGPATSLQAGGAS